MSRLQLAQIQAAREAITGHVHVTPMLSSVRTSELVGMHVLLKAELFQRTGSFKPRGVMTKLLRLTPEQRGRGVVAASSGNHAQALACCARDLGIDCVAVMWHGASPQKIEAVRGYGGIVDLEAADAFEAARRAEQLAEESGRTLVAAYDDVDVMAGQGTLGLEILDDAAEPDVVLVPVSGGGLLAGVATAVKARRPATRVIAVEPQRSPALTLALAAGRPVAVANDSVADGLGAPAIGDACFAILRELVDDVVLVDDEEIVAAMQWLYETVKIAAEPAGAASTAALLAGRVPGRSSETAVAIVSGGNTDLQVAAQLLGKRDGLNADELSSCL